MSRRPYIEILDIRTGTFRKTGLGAAFDTLDEARRDFESRRFLIKKEGGFILDLHHANDDIEDSIEIDATAVEAITGEEVKSAEEYEQFDMEYWKTAMEPANQKTHLTEERG